MNRSVQTECAACNGCILPLKNFFYLTIDYQGNLVVITDHVKYPTVEVDDKDKLITFHELDVTDFVKPETKMIYNGIHKITW